MSTRYNFTKLFQCEVKRQLQKKGIPVESEYELDGNNIKAPVDLYYKSSAGKEYLIELEIHRADPSNNIAKIAYILNNDETIRNISVIQVFSPQYQIASGTSAKMDVSQYLGKVLIDEKCGLEYHPIELEGYTREQFNKIYETFIPGQPSRRNVAELIKMAEQIAKKIIKKM